MNKMSFVSGSIPYDGTSPLKNIKHEKFIQAYLKTGSGKIAATLSGFSKDTATAKASTLLAKEDIKMRYNYLMEKVVEEKIWDKQQILERIQEIADKTTSKGYEKLKALELLGKARAIFIDKVNHSGKISTEATNIFVIDKETKDLVSQL